MDLLPKMFNNIQPLTIFARSSQMFDRVLNTLLGYHCMFRSKLYLDFKIFLRIFVAIKVTEPCAPVHSLPSKEFLTFFLFLIQLRYTLQIVIMNYSSSINKLLISFGSFHIAQLLREKYPNTEFILSIFSCIRTEYGHLLHQSPYSVRIQENTYQKKVCIWTFSRSDLHTQAASNFTKFKVKITLRGRKRREVVGIYYYFPHYKLLL